MLGSPTRIWCLWFSSWSLHTHTHTHTHTYIGVGGEGICLVAVLCTWSSTSAVIVGKENDYFENKKTQIKFWIHIYIDRNISIKSVIIQKKIKYGC